MDYSQVPDNGANVYQTAIQPAEDPEVPNYKVSEELRNVLLEYADLTKCLQKDGKALRLKRKQHRESLQKDVADMAMVKERLDQLSDPIQHFLQNIGRDRLKLSCGGVVKVQRTKRKRKLEPDYIAENMLARGITDRTQISLINQMIFDRPVDYIEKLQYTTGKGN